MIMRSISRFEQQLIGGVAERVPSSDGARLRADMMAATATDVVLDGSRVSFSLDGYDSPDYEGQHPFPVEIRLCDSDGSELTAVLYADGNGRLYELEMIRWDGGPLVSPDPGTLKFY